MDYQTGSHPPAQHLRAMAMQVLLDGTAGACRAAREGRAVLPQYGDRAMRQAQIAPRSVPRLRITTDSLDPQA